MTEANYDDWHKTSKLPLLPDNTRVWITTDNSHIPGRVTSTAGTPQSYLVDTKKFECDATWS